MRSSIWCRSLNVFRKRFSKVVQVMAVLSLFICVFVIVYGLTRDYDFLKAMAWATGEIGFNDPVS